MKKFTVKKKIMVDEQGIEYSEIKKPLATKRRSLLPTRSNSDVKSIVQNKVKSNQERNAYLSGNPIPKKQKGVDDSVKMKLLWQQHKNKNK